MRKIRSRLSFQHIVQPSLRLIGSKRLYQKSRDLPHRFKVFDETRVHLVGVKVIDPGGDIFSYREQPVNMMRAIGSRNWFEVATLLVLI